jgi:hypothetical protein
MVMSIHANDLVYLMRAVRRRGSWSICALTLTDSEAPVIERWEERVSYTNRYLKGALDRRCGVGVGVWHTYTQAVDAVCHRNILGFFFLFLIEHIRKGAIINPSFPGQTVVPVTTELFWLDELHSIGHNIRLCCSLLAWIPDEAHMFPQRLTSDDIAACSFYCSRLLFARVKTLPQQEIRKIKTRKSAEESSTVQPQLVAIKSLNAINTWNQSISILLPVTGRIEFLYTLKFRPQTLHIGVCFIGTLLDTHWTHHLTLYEVTRILHCVIKCRYSIDFRLKFLSANMCCILHCIVIKSNVQKFQAKKNVIDEARNLKLKRASTMLSRRRIKDQ